MKKALLRLLVDPRDRMSMQLQDDASPEGDAILSGTLCTAGGACYPIRNGIPRLTTSDDVGQGKTSEAFGFKWKKRDTYDSPGAKKNALEWILPKYGFKDLRAWVDYFNRAEIVLDLGCGSGLSSSLFLDTPHWTGHAAWIGLDVSDAIDVAQERLAHVANTHFVQGDALALPFADDSIDCIFSEGVLHHTPSTRAAIASAARVLKIGGDFNFYVYRKKSPLREFTDDFVRERISGLSEDAAWAEMRTLTLLAKALSEINATVTVPVDVPLLGISAGEHNVQRLIYWNFAKLYWNSGLSLEENVHINFDWYRPAYAHRQTANEVRTWCDESELTITHFHEQESGYTIRATKVT
jgi:arsenite methyltransferase